MTRILKSLFDGLFGPSSSKLVESEAESRMRRLLSKSRHHYEVLNRWGSRPPLSSNHRKLAHFLERVKKEKNNFSHLYTPERNHLSKEMRKECEELLTHYQELIEDKEALLDTLRKADR